MSLATSVKSAKEQLGLVMLGNIVLMAIVVRIAMSPRIHEEVTDPLYNGLMLLGCVEFFIGFGMSFFKKNRAWGLGLMYGSAFSALLAVLGVIGVFIHGVLTGEIRFLG